FDASDIEKERGVIIEEIMMYRDHPEHVVQEMLHHILWKNHQLGRPLVGTPVSLRRMTRDDILKFKQKKYVAQNTVFVFAGRIRHETGVAHVEKLMTEYPALRKPSAKPVTHAVKQEKMILKSKDIEQTQLAIGFRTFGRSDKRRYTLKVLSVILGENMSSRLFQVVREKHGLAYSVHSGFQLLADTGGFVVSAGLDKKKRHKALDLIFREIRRLKQESVKEKELARAREYIVGHLRLGLESPSGQMIWVGEHLLHYGKSIPAEEVIDAIYAVRSADVQALAGTIFRERATSLAMLSSGLAEKDSDSVRSVLATL
ncbi:M16 family metallopeptidase, partial [Verrucomicrobiota bacterium]